MDLPDPDAVITDHRLKQVQTTLRHSLWTGFTLVIPLLVTLLVIGFVVGFLFRVLSPVVDAMDVASGGILSGIVLKLVTLAVLVGVIFVVGFMANRRTDEDDIAGRFDAAMGAIPGVGTVYSSSRRMSDTLISADSKSFREVKLVKFPGEGLFALGFLTDDAPTKVAAATGTNEMRTLFVPLSPNPFMGGVLIYAAEDNLLDVDMTITQAASAIMTSGVTGNSDDEGVRSAKTTDHEAD